MTQKGKCNPGICKLPIISCSLQVPGQQQQQKIHEVKLLFKMWLCCSFLWVHNTQFNNCFSTP